MILASFKRSTLENPSTNLRDFFLDSPDVHAGVTVNERTALNYTAFLACVRYLANSIAMPPLKVYQRNGERREEARGHRNWSLLHDRPNPEMGSFQWRETAMGHLLTWGNFFAEKELDTNGRTVALWPLRPDRVDVVREGGRKKLAVRMSDGSMAKLDAGKYLHVAGLGYDGTVGYSPVRLMKQAIGLGLVSEEHGSRFFGSGGRVPYVVTAPMPMTLEAQQRWRKAWETTHGGSGEGLRKSQRVAILDEGMSIETIGLSNEDSQFLETRAFQGQAMAQGFGVPQHKIQILENADFSNIEKQAIEALTDSVMPWAVRWEQAYNWELFEAIERQTYYTKHTLDILLRGDAETRAKALEIRRRNGTLNADEWRALEDENPLPDGQGSKYIVESNMQDLAKVGEEPAAPPPMPALNSAPPAEPRAAVDTTEHRGIRSAESRRRLHAAYMRLFEQAAQKFVNREARAALRFLKRAFETEQPVENLIAALEEFYRSFGDVVRKLLLPVVLALAELIRAEIEAEVGGQVEADALERFSAKYVDDYTERHVRGSMAQIRKLAQETGREDLQEALATRFGEWETGRAAKIGMNEAVRSGNAIASTAYIALGVAALVWRTVGENCPLCSKMNGRRVGPGSAFLNKGDLVPGDADTATLEVKSTVKHPPLHRGCDCVLGAG